MFYLAVDAYISVAVSVATLIEAKHHEPLNNSFAITFGFYELALYSP